MKSPPNPIIDTEEKKAVVMFGYEPLWEREPVRAVFARYETNASEARITDKGNWLFYQKKRYALNKGGEPTSFDERPEYTDECMVELETRVLGLFWQRSRDEMIYWPQADLPDEYCNKIPFPLVASEL